MPGGDIQDEYIGYVEGGLSVGKKFLVRGCADLTESTTNTISSSSTLNQVLEQGYLTAGPGFSVLFSPHWQLHTDLRWTVDGRTTAKLFHVIAGLAYLW